MNTPTAHSPGPWSTSKEDGCWQIYDADGALIADQIGAADAHLIAAAPNLKVDAFGEPRVRYVRVSLNGSHMVCSPADAAAYIDDANDDDGYTLTDVYLSEREANDLPEFNGFCHGASTAAARGASPAPSPDYCSDKSLGLSKPARDYCPEKLKPGGCQLHNLHCGYPACNAAPPSAPRPDEVDSAQATNKGNESGHRYLDGEIIRVEPGREGSPVSHILWDSYAGREVRIYPRISAIDEVSELYAAYVKGWDAALERAAFICQGVNNHDNPMTANDCADEILALVKTQTTEAA